MRAALPPLVSIPAGAAIATARLASPVFVALELFGTVPLAVEDLTLVTRFLAFAVVYGGCLGVAAGVSRSGLPPARDRTVVLASGLAAAATALVLTLVFLTSVLDPVDPLSRVVVTAVTSAAAIGVQVAVVVFAGLALGRRLR